jgi:Caspase domain
MEITKSLIGSRFVMDVGGCPFNWLAYPRPLFQLNMLPNQASRLIPGQQKELRGAAAKVFYFLAICRDDLTSSCALISCSKPCQSSPKLHVSLSPVMSRKKSLLIGINYTGSQNELHGCIQDVENVSQFLSYRGYSDDPRSQVILRDDQEGSYYPSGHNILVFPPPKIL